MINGSMQLIAGMPVVTLSDIARLRLDSISFFLLLILLATLVVRWCWNTISVDFPSLPQLSFRKSFAIVTLWGLVFLLALTMISGARELLTPGAWKKEGFTYQLREGTGSDEPDSSSANNFELRRQRLSHAYALLESYAKEHDQSFPRNLVDAVAASGMRHPPEWPGAEYEYFAGRDLESRGERLLAEPNVFQGPRLAMLVGGEIVEE